MRVMSRRPLAGTVSRVYSCAPCSSQGTPRDTTMSPTRSPYETTQLLPHHLGVGSCTVGQELWTEIKGNIRLMRDQGHEAVQEGLVHLWHLLNIWRYQWSGYSACQTTARLVLSVGVFVSLWQHHGVQWVGRWILSRGTLGSNWVLFHQTLDKCVISVHWSVGMTIWLSTVMDICVGIVFTTKSQHGWMFQREV